VKFAILAVDKQVDGFLLDAGRIFARRQEWQAASARQFVDVSVDFRCDDGFVDNECAPVVGTARDWVGFLAGRRDYLGGEREAPFFLCWRWRGQHRQDGEHGKEFHAGEHTPALA